MRALLANLLLASAAFVMIVESKSNLLRAENVFGWQDKSPPRHNNKRTSNPYKSPQHSTTSPLRRSENVFHWQAPKYNVIHASSKSIESTNPLNNIKLQPRKKELWLPWPLGELRKDYHRFAEQHLRQSEVVHQTPKLQEDNAPSLLQQSKKWANRFFQRNPSAARNIKEPDKYWIKETTTPMATASANREEEKQRGKKAVSRGGGEKQWDHEMIFKYVKLQMKVRLRQLGYVGSDFSVHLPPASPTLLLMYILPSTQDPLRKLVKFSLTGATISWMHSEATKYRRLAPLPIMRGVNVRRPELMPFLPEELDREIDEQVASPKEKPQLVSVSHSNNTHTLWDPFQSFGTISSAYRSWLEGQSLREKKMYEQRRIETRSRLLELVPSMNSTDMSENSYALITGASRGIGRALAVELARYRIPLILVARDITKLTRVAQEIEKYYNVPCRVLQADLSNPNCASLIHAATTEAGLKVDILINNAGVCSQGEMIEGDVSSTMNMIQVNIGSVVRLSQLYGKDMKERRRGRMMFVSSMAGAMPGCASVGVYAATKAFEKSLAASLGREMEKWGVGVTCLLPGAVKDTDFASRSDVEAAVCFQVPGYAKSPELVAEEGIKALMLGYPEVYPGWENKIFAKFLLTHLPARVTGLIGEYAWSPWQLGMLPKNKIDYSEGVPRATNSVSSHNTWKFRRPSGNILKLPDLSKIQMPKASDNILLSDITNEAMQLNRTNLDVDTNAYGKMEPTVLDNSTNLSLLLPSDGTPEQPASPPPKADKSLFSVDGMNGGEVNFNLANVPEANETWYPSMLDQKEYDFRDRRKDY